MRLIVSTLDSGECLTQLERKLSTANFVRLEPMPEEEGGKLLDLWLADARRRLQDDQRAEVLGKFEASGLPLYLKLEFEEARLWKSYGVPRRLGADVSDMLRELFRRLSEDHGHMMVSRSLGYLAAAKNGLSEDELLDVLSLDNELLEDFVKRARHEPPERRLPVVVWSRLYFDLEAYLTERNIDGTNLLAFFHRQFDEVVAENYLVGDEKLRQHSGLAQFFGDQPLQIEKDGRRNPNLRKVSELPFQQMQGERWNDLERTLCDLEFIEAKCAAGMTYQLVGDYQEGLAAVGGQKGWSGRNQVIEFSRFVQRQAHILREHPSVTFQQAANQSDSTSLAQMARRRFDAGLETRPWLRWVNKSQYSSPCLMTFTGHKYAVDSCAFTSDGARFVSGSWDRTLKLWDALSGQELLTIDDYQSEVNSCAFSPDDRRLAAVYDRGYAKGPLLIWDSNTGARLAFLKGDFRAWRFTPDGKRITALSWNHILTIWDAEQGLLAAEFPLDGKVQFQACAFAPDATHLATSRWEGEVLKVWDVETGSELANLAGHAGKIHACAFSSDGRQILSASHDHTLRLWDAMTGEHLSTFSGHAGPVLFCAFSPDGDRIVSVGGDEKILLWDARTGKKLNVLGHTEAPWNCAFSPDGGRILSRSSHTTLKLWDGRTGAELCTLTGHADVVNAYVMSPDGKRILSGSFDRTVRLWDAQSNNNTAGEEKHTSAVTSCAFAPSGTRFASASLDGTLKLWHIKTGAALASYVYGNALAACAFSPDGLRIAVSFLDSAPGMLDRSTSGGSGSFSPTMISLLIKASSVPPKGLEGRVYSAGSGYVELLKLYDAATGTELLTLAGHVGAVRGCAFSTDGLRILSGADDGKLKLWDAATGQELVSFDTGGDKVTACAIAPNRKHLLSCSSDGDLRIWKLRQDNYMQLLKGALLGFGLALFHPEVKP